MRRTSCIRILATPTPYGRRLGIEGGYDILSVGFASGAFQRLKRFARLALMVI
ncbi:hypothetical protein AB7M70_007639 [Bradyrhizobium japonicum]